MVVWVFHQTRQMLGLNQDSVEVCVSEADAKFNVFGRGQMFVGFEFRSGFLDDKFSSIGSRHILGSSKELSIERERLGSRLRRRHCGFQGPEKSVKK